MRMAEQAGSWARRHGGWLDGQVAVVTGGGSGLGAAIGRELARAGARVVLADLDADRARATAAAIVTSGGRAQAAEVDVARADSVEALFDRVVAESGRLDVLFNNAGVTVIGEARDLSLEHWRRVLDVNLWGVVHGCHFAYRHMSTQGSGHIVNVASGFGLVPSPANAPYATAKWAVVGLSETLRVEAADLGIAVSVACPGLVRTPLLERSPAVNVDLGQWLARFPFPAIDADAAARAIVAGVRRKQAVIAFPAYVRFLVWLYRSWPRLSDRLSRRSIRDFRALRREP